MFAKKIIKIRKILTIQNQYMHGEPTELKNLVANKIINGQKRIKQFRKEHGSKKVSDVTIDMLYGGMRGLNALIYEISSQDPIQGVLYHGYTVSEIKKLLTKAPGGEEPQPEAIFWLHLTGEIPNQQQVENLSHAMLNRASLPFHVVTMLDNMPKSVTPIVQLSAALTLLNTESQFACAYEKGIPKSAYWEYIYEDCMDLISKLPVVAAKIYHNACVDGRQFDAIDPSKDCSYNFVRLLGFDDPMFVEYMRLYITILSDNDGGNVPTHTVNLVNSTLSDPYLSMAASVNSSAGFLQTVAMSEVVNMLKAIQNQLGDTPCDDELTKFIEDQIDAGRFIPGFGHREPTKQSPRYNAFKEFGMKHASSDVLFQLSLKLCRLTPSILRERKKVRASNPNNLLHTGALFHHFGLTDCNFHPLIYVVARSLGALASIIWNRGMGYPIERPKSMSTNDLMKLVQK